MTFVVDLIKYLPGVLKQFNITAPAPQNNLTATRSPISTDNASAGYGVGSIWDFLDFNGEGITERWRLHGFSGTDAIWQPEKDVIRLGEQNYRVSRDSSVTEETTLFSCTVPPLGPNDIIHVRYRGYTDDTGIAKDRKLYINDDLIALNSLANFVREEQDFVLANRNNTSDTLGPMYNKNVSFGTTSSTLFANSVIDTSAQTILSFSVKWASVNATPYYYHLEGIYADLRRGPTA